MTQGLNTVIYSGKFSVHSQNAKVEKEDYLRCFSVPEGPMEHENTDENKRLWRGGSWQRSGL